MNTLVRQRWLCGKDIGLSALLAIRDSLVGKTHISVYQGESWGEDTGRYVKESCEDNGLSYIGLGQSCGEHTDMSWAVLW